MRSAQIVQSTSRQNWPQRVGLTARPDLYAVVAFCLIGLLLTLNFIFRFPELGAIIQQYNQF